MSLQTKILKHMNKSNIKKDCQQNQQLDHEFLADEMNIFEWSDILDIRSCI